MTDNSLIPRPKSAVYFCLNSQILNIVKNPLDNYKFLVVYYVHRIMAYERSGEMTDFMDKLKYARQAELEIQTNLEHIERIHKIMKLPRRSIKYSQELAEKLAALETRLNALIDEAVDRKNDALNILDALSGDERTVLYQYYILAKDWQKISDELYMSERTVYNLRKKAVERLEARYSGLAQTSKRAAG